MIVKTSYMMSSFIISCEISYIMSMLYGKLTSFFHYDDGGVFFSYVTYFWLFGAIS